MSVTKLCASDVHRILPLLHQVHDLHLVHQPERYAPLPSDRELIAFLHGWLDQPDLFGLSYEVDGTILGYAIYEIERRIASPFRRAETRAMLHHISVDKGHRRSGIGTMLIAEIRAHLQREGGQVLAASYGIFNTASARLLARAGLQPVMVFAEWRDQSA